MVEIAREQAFEVERVRLQKGRYHEIVLLSHHTNWTHKRGGSVTPCEDQQQTHKKSGITLFVVPIYTAFYCNRVMPPTTTTQTPLQQNMPHPLSCIANLTQPRRSLHEAICDV